jgi:threonine dehydratase
MPTLPTLAEIEAAAQVVYRALAPTPQYRWALLQAHLDHVVQVSDDEAAHAMRALYNDTHNVAEGAGAAAFAAALQQRDRLRGQCVGVSLTGANVDAAVLARVLQQA